MKNVSMFDQFFIYWDEYFRVFKNLLIEKFENTIKEK